MIHSVRLVVFVLAIAAAAVFLGACSSPSPTPLELGTATPVRPATVGGETPAATAAVVQSDATPTSAVGRDTPGPTGGTGQPTPAGQQATPAPTPAAGGAPASYFGVSTYGEIPFNKEARALAVLAGVQLVRTSVDWVAVEPVEGEYHWGGVDGTLRPLIGNNFAPLVIILKNPEWAAKTPCGPVDRLDAFERFMGALAARYPEVKYWALYNEVDNANYPDFNSGGCFGGNDVNANSKLDVEEYADMLRIARQAVHRANPNAQLVTGALAFDNFTEATAPSDYPGGGKGGNFNYNFLPQLLSFIAAHPLPANEGYFDILSFNFYGIYGPYWERTAGGIGISAKVNMLNKMLSEAGLSYPLMVSETGESSAKEGNQAQSAFLVKTFARGRASGLHAVTWWTFKDFADTAPAPSNTWKYGIVDQDLKPKPSYAAYQTMTRLLTGAAFGQPLVVDGGEGYLFSKEGAGIAVVWALSDNPVTITFAGKRVRVTDLYGGEKIVADGSPDDTDGAVDRVGLVIDQSPVYVQRVP